VYPKWTVRCQAFETVRQAPRQLPTDVSAASSFSAQIVARHPNLITAPLALMIARYPDQQLMRA